MATKPVEYSRLVAGWIRNYPLAPRYGRHERTWLRTAGGLRLSAARLLHDWARDPKELWLVPGGGHGSDPFTRAMADGVLDAVTARVRALPMTRARVPSP